MRRNILSKVLLSLVLSLQLNFARAEIIFVENKPQWRAQNFIANQIKGIGLVDSYQEDNSDKSYVYDNALAAIACIKLDNSGMAKEILDTLSSEVQKTLQNVPFESYNYSINTGEGSGLAYCGNSAWLLQALNIYQKTKTSKIYYAAQKSLADFLVSLQDPVDGGLRGSAYEYWKSTEHNIIAYVALRNFGRLNHLAAYITKANKIKVFLTRSGIWNGTFFNRGPQDTTKVTDVQALGVLLLGKTYAGALSWLESNLSATKQFNSSMISGFDYNADLDTVWLEGTLQAALAFYASGDAAKGDFYYNEACKAIQSDGSIVLATNRGTASDSWILESWRAIAPTCWMIFYSLKFNPLILY